MLAGQVDVTLFQFCGLTGEECVEMDSEAEAPAAGRVTQSGRDYGGWELAKVLPGRLPLE